MPTDTAPAIRGILFDKDGTLIDYLKSWTPVNYELGRIAAAGDAKLADHLLRACGMNPETGLVEADSLLAAGTAVEIAEGMVAAGATVPLEILSDEFDGLFARSGDYAMPVTDLAQFFQRLRQAGFRLGVASSDNERSIRQTAERFGFLVNLDFIAGYDSGHGVKPEPGMVLAFCAATGLAPAEVAMVGDNNHDMHMGRTAGTGLTIAVLTGTGTRQSLSAAADHVFDDITALIPLLNA